MAQEESNPFMFASCSLMMASLFAYSASVQLDDPDWFLWFPLYAVASGVNILGAKMKSEVLKKVAKVVFYFGVFLFVKVVMEGYHLQGMGGLWSINVEERIVREKLGSGLVIISMFLQLQVRKISEGSERKKIGGAVATNYAVYGMAALVAVAFGLCFWFFVFVKDIRK